MRKFLLAIAGITCSIAVSATPALANPNEVDDTTKTFSAEVHIVDQSGDHVFPVVTPNKTLSQFLLDRGLTLEDYRYGDNKELDGTNVLDDSEVAKIYKVSSKGESSLVDLPVPTEEKKTDDLMVGETKVEQEGSAGKLLKTIVVTGLKGSDVTTTQESLIVLEASKPKVVLVGTKTPEVVVEEQQGVNAPWATSDKKTIDTIKNGTSNNQLVNVLTAQVGKPYVWGAEGPDSFDCSGLVYYVMNQSGLKIPRLTAADYGARATTVQLKDIKPGDIFWTTQHIAIYAGDGKVIHAANPRVGVIVTNLSYFTSGDYTLARLS